MSVASIKLSPLDVDLVRADFPILQTRTHGKPLIYLDNGASTQKPQALLDAETRFYERHYANIHRGVYELSQQATAAYEAARATAARFINAREETEIVFTRGTTESINLVAAGFRSLLKSGDEIIITALEHHSNIVPWQMAAQAAGAVIKVVPINDAGELQMDEFERLLNERTKLVAVTHLSNALGSIIDVQRITRLAHVHRAAVLIDGAQWIAHGSTDVQKIHCDFYCFSGHKLYGPTGIGVLYGKREWLEKLPPYQGGGDMIETVRFEQTTYAPIPAKFEAGTPNIAGAIGLAAAIDYVQSVGLDAIADHEHALLTHATAAMETIDGVRILGTARNKGSVISFVVEQPPIASLDLGMALDKQGIAVRTGHHCCMPLMDRLGVPSTTRASFGLYNTMQEVDAFVATLRSIVDAKRQSASAGRQQIAEWQCASAALDLSSPAAAMVSRSSAGDLQFAAAASDSPTAVAADFADTFEFLFEREDKMQQLLDYASALPHQFDVLKKLTDRVPGCQSQVYLLSRAMPAQADRLEFAADADAEIVRGEIVLLQKLLSGQKAKDILAFDLPGFFARIGLEQFLSQQRRTGMAAMIERLRAHAARLVKP